MWRWWMWPLWMWQCFLWRWWRSLPPDPPDGIRRISDSVYELRMPRGPPEIELVFIHGLQLCDFSEAYWRTWVVGKKDKGGREICWPRAWLGEEFPGARILSLKYDSCILRTDTTGTMDGYLLLESLVQEMVEMAGIGQQKNCPVVFVCHSVGGLVVKEIVIKAYRKYGNNSKYVNFLQNIRGFHFYATPHDGSKLADLAEYLPFMGGMVNLVAVINKELDRLNDEFARIQREDYINTWQFSVVAETQITSYYGFSAMVVEEASARHEYNKFLAVGADHFGICKPGDKTSTSYLYLKNFIESVVQDNKLRKDNLLKIPTFVVGMETRVNEVCERLKGHCVLGLVGMGGVGKTTLSKYVFNVEKDKFDRYCFLEDVKSRGNIEAYQKKLFLDLCGGQWNESYGTNYHLGKIKQCIISKKVLLVVDDVGEGVNLTALEVPTFNHGKSGSKVIVTTRRRDIFENQEDIMDVGFLSEIQAMELFSHYAFKDVDESVRVQFDSQAKNIVEACGKLPLSLEVIGQFLRSKWKDKSCESIEKKMEVWDEALQRLKKAEPFDGSSEDKKLWARLRISYDDLSSKEQSIFLDMACTLLRCVTFLNVYNAIEMLGRDLLEQIWNSPIAIQNLTNRSLIKWSDDNMLVIHDQLQDMARGIVMNEVNGDKSPVWDNDGGLHFMVQKRGFTTLEGILLTGVNETFQKYKRQKYYIVEGLHTKVVDYFSNLRFLCLFKCEDQVVQYFIRLSTSKLRFIIIDESNIIERNIVELIELCELRVLFIINCMNLESLPTSIGNLSLIRALDLSYCIRLKSLPESVSELQKLQVFKLHHCESLETLPTSIGNLSLLIKLDLSSCRGLKSLPESVGGLQKLTLLKLRDCESLETLPTSIGNLSLLIELDLSSCRGLKSLPESVGGLQKLQVFKLRDCESLETLPTSISNLSLLIKLDLSSCRGLKSLPESVGGLQKLKLLKLRDCESLETLPTSIGNLSLLIKLDLSSCRGLKSLPESVGGLQKLQVLKLSYCKSLETLPTSIGSLSLLIKLDLSSCRGLKSLPKSVDGLQKLQVLKLWDCESLETLPISLATYLFSSSLTYPFVDD